MDALRVSTAWVTLDMVFVTGAAWDTAAGGWRVGYFIVNPPGRGAGDTVRGSHSGDTVRDTVRGRHSERHSERETQ
jgi:pullulanase/glycogen debranching enzyme